MSYTERGHGKGETNESVRHVKIQLHPVVVTNAKAKSLHLLAMASHPPAMASHPLAMASHLLAMASQDAGGQAEKTSSRNTNQTRTPTHGTQLGVSLREKPLNGDHIAPLKSGNKPARTTAKVPAKMLNSESG